MSRPQARRFAFAILAGFPAIAPFRADATDYTITYTATVTSGIGTGFGVTAPFGDASALVGKSATLQFVVRQALATPSATHSPSADSARLDSTSLETAALAIVPTLTIGDISVMLVNPALAAYQDFDQAARYYNPDPFEGSGSQRAEDLYYYAAATATTMSYSLNTSIAAASTSDYTWYEPLPLDEPFTRNGGGELGGVDSRTYALGSATPSQAFDIILDPTSITVADIAGVPEPASWAMNLAGFGLIGGALRGHRKTRAAFAQ